MKTLEFLLMFESIFLGLLVLYGVSDNNFNQYIQGPLQAITTPFPAQPALSFTNIIDATGSIGLELFYGFQLLGTLLFKFGAGIFLLFGLYQALNSDFGIPFLGYIFTAFILITILNATVILRGSPQGV